MATIRHLRNAPITEAIVDFRVALPSEFQPDQLRQAAARLAREYPKAEERKATETQVQLVGGQPQPAQTRDLGFQGLWLRTEDEKSVAQFRVNGFTFNRLKPYTRWDQILPQAWQLWSLYVDLARPQSVTRVALRYINHMSLPSPVSSIADYIVTSPPLPSSVPQVLSSFVTRLTLEYPERHMRANVIQVVEPGVESAAPSLLLDVDVYRTGDFPVDERTLRPILDDLRAYKNEIFFGTLQERFVELFE
jgi:uncharacterized protein (TIGR04255 family)